MGDCLDLPTIPPPPSLPTGISFTPPPLPRPPTSLLCCKLPPLPPKVTAMIAKYEAGIAIQFPPAPPAVQVLLADLEQARITINTYIQNLPLSCPRALEQAAQSAVDEASS